MNYELKQTKLKSGKFHYQVIDENGTIISERKSNREYVACTIDGSFYWGRLNFIGKGDYKGLLNWAITRMNMTEEDFLKRYPRNIYNNNYNDEVKEGKATYECFKTIAYKK